MRKASKRKTAKEEALEGIARIRRNGFDLGDETIENIIRKFRPKKAFLILTVAARAHRRFVPVH